jgi:hypothetical protein
MRFMELLLVSDVDVLPARTTVLDGPDAANAPT